MSFTQEQYDKIGKAIHAVMPPNTAFCVFLHEQGTPEAKLFANMSWDSLRNFIASAVGSFMTADMKGDVTKESEAR